LSADCGLLFLLASRGRWLSACTCFPPPPRAVRRRWLQFRPLRPAFSLSGLLLRMIEPGLQQRQPLFDAEPGGAP
jgi:hypothetical protein